METFRAFMEVFPAIAMILLVCVVGSSTYLFNSRLDADKKDSLKKP